MFILYFIIIICLFGNKGEIISRMPLDREETSLYEISVLACDQGARCGFTLVRVRVSDENDNSPRFLLPEYKTCIHSSLPVNTGFLTVRLTIIVFV